FDALDRRLRQHSEVVQQKVKTHAEGGPRHGRVARLFVEDGYGFIESDDGLEVYFHAHAVKKGKFKELTPGAAVIFAQEEGDKGPQATWVQPV
ncbi:MAG TPA: cold shock domain-containing protein, partial [Desulfobaccales bacterium]|nr:cold shock domain-containing protein [Desulfobaccales bacterium]